MSITINQLRHHAQELQTQAAEALRMADELEKLPAPINSAIISVKAMLHRHELCIVSRDALRHALLCMNEFEPDGLCEQVEHKAALSAVESAIEK